MSTIIDEIKKNQFEFGRLETPLQKQRYAVLVSDTEVILARCTCENCKHFDKKRKATVSGLGYCPIIKLTMWDETFGCNQWQSKEEKEG